MRLYRLKKIGSLDDLHLGEEPAPCPGANQVLLRVRACSLNRRDLNMVAGFYGGGSAKPDLIPLSDGAGEITAVGAQVTRWKLGDRVMPIFTQHWIGGRLKPEYAQSALGGPIDGMLAENVLVGEEGLVRIPAHLDFEQAATLPCAALTAWHAAMVKGALSAGMTLLTLGTGGVSLFALQFARMTGARVICTTGSEEKAQRLHALGAAAVINYRTTPDWDKAVLDVSGGGVDVVVDVGGPGTTAKSIGALRFGGHVSSMGNLAGKGTIDPGALFQKRASMCGIHVGSRDMFEAMNRAIEVTRLEPIIDRVFGFTEAKAAYEYLASGKHFGKVVIRVD